MGDNIGCQAALLVSTKYAEDLGFEMGMFAGSVASLTILGAPDKILLTLSEYADQARRITRASGLPVFCDADHGYGNAMNVMRTVEELENAGVAGLNWSVRAPHKMSKYAELSCGHTIRQ